MKIAIITDGNLKLGLGHVYQSISLAREILERNRTDIEIRFMTKSNESVADLIMTSGYDVERYKNDLSIFQDLLLWKPDRIIFDKLDVSANLAKDIKSRLMGKLVIMTNLTRANKYADIIVLADIGSNFVNIRRDPTKGRVEFFGPKYWIMRPEFEQYHRIKKARPKTVRKIMLGFGGSDPLNLSSIVSNELLKLPESFKIHLVLGLAFPHCRELKQVLKNNDASRSTITVVQNVKNMAELMFENDVVFASPGMSYFEALKVGTPVVGFHQNEIQLQAYQKHLKTLDKTDVKQIHLILKNKQFFYPDDEFVKSLQIGEGVSEIIDEILL